MADLFAGFPVSDFPRSLRWYTEVLGSQPSFFPNEREAVWELAQHCYVYIELLPDRAGAAMSMMMVDDIDATTAVISRGGIEPTRIEKYDEGMRKVVYADPDGNEMSFGGVSTS